MKTPIKSVFRIIKMLLLLGVCNSSIHAQVVLNFDKEMTPICEPTDLHLFSFTMPEFNNDNSSNLYCGGTRENVAYISFVAWVPNMNLTLSPSNCSSSFMDFKRGIQAAIYTLDQDCEVEMVESQCSCNDRIEDIEFMLMDLIPGVQYYIFIDGCASDPDIGDQCDIEIIIDANATAQNAYAIPPDVAIEFTDETGEGVFCEGEKVTMDIPSLRNINNTQNYTIERFFKDGTVESEPLSIDSAYCFTIPENLEKMYFDVVVASICDAGINIFDSLIVSPAGIQVFNDTTLCFGESLILADWQGGPLDQAGFYSDTIKQADGCDLIQEINIAYYDLPTDQVDTTVCDFPVMIAGQVFNGPVTNERVLLQGQSVNGCDSIVNVSISESIFDGAIVQLSCADNQIVLGFEEDATSIFDSYILVWDYNGDIEVGDNITIQSGDNVTLRLEYFLDNLSCNQTYTGTFNSVPFDGDFDATCRNGMIDLRFNPTTSSHDNAIYTWMVDGVMSTNTTNQIMVSSTAIVSLEVQAFNALESCTHAFGPYRFWENAVAGMIEAIDCLDDSLTLGFNPLQTNFDDIIYNWSSSDGNTFSDASILVPNDVEVDLVAEIIFDGQSCLYDFGPYNFNNEINCDASCVPADIILTSSLDTFCHTSGMPLTSIPIDVDVTSNLGLNTGIGTWLNPEVDDNNFFQPIALTDSLYELIFVFDEDGCIARDTIEIEVLIKPIFELEFDADTICLGETFTAFANISNDFEGIHWRYNEGVISLVSGDTTTAGPIVFRPEAPFVFFYDVDVFKGGCSSTIRRYLVVQPPVEDPVFTCMPSTNEIFVEWNQDDCADSYDIYLDGTLLSNTLDNSLLIENLDMNTTYEIEVVMNSNCGCLAIPRSIMMCETTDCPSGNLNIDVTSVVNCSGSGRDSISYSLNLSTPLIDADTVWTGTGITQDGIIDHVDNFTTVTPGTYTIYLTISNATCSYMDSFSYTLIRVPELLVNIEEQNCYSDDFTLASANAVGIYPFNLTLNGDGINPGETFVLEAGENEIVLTLDNTNDPSIPNGCVQIENIFYDPPKTEDPEIIILGPEELEADSTGVFNFDFLEDTLYVIQNNLSYQWSVDGNVVCASPEQWTDFQDYLECLELEWAATDNFELCFDLDYNDGCQTSVCRNIQISETESYFYLPNSFSPSSDNFTNQEWRIFSNNPNFKVKKAQIFDRWGTEVQILENVEAEDGMVSIWDGRKNDEEVTPGVYVYLIEFELRNETVLRKGALTLFR